MPVVPLRSATPFRLAIIFLGLLAAGAMAAADDLPQSVSELNPSVKPTVHLVEVGIADHYQPGHVNPVRIQLTNASDGKSEVELDVTVTGNAQGASDHPEEHYIGVYSLAPREARTVEMPLLLQVTEPEVKVAAKQPGASKSFSEEKTKPQGDFHNGLIAVVGRSKIDCDWTRGEVVESGSEKLQSKKASRVSLVCWTEIPGSVLRYKPASSVVVLRPLAEFAAGEVAALEGYARSGGTVVFVGGSEKGIGLFEGKAGSASGGKGEAVLRDESLGFGRIHRVAATESELADLYNKSLLLGGVIEPKDNSDDDDEDQPPPAPGRRFTFTGFGSLTTALLQASGPAFNFLSLRAILLWLGSYILMVGLVNFLVLRWLRLREWGWLTVPLIALAFAGGLYGSTVAQRSGAMRLDEVRVHWMDDQSPLAWTQEAMRVSAPNKINLTAQMTSDRVWTGPSSALEQGSRQQMANLFVAAARDLRGHDWQVRLAPRQSFQLPMLQWSFRDLDFEHAVTMPGTMHFDSSGQLVNETGLNFRDAVLCTAGRKVSLGPMAPGARVDLSKAKSEQRVKPTSPTPNDFQSPWQADTVIHAGEACHMPSSWLPSGGELGANGATFFGVSDEPWQGLVMPGQQYTHKQTTLTVVTFAKAPSQQ